ncbi:MAG TPA: hypothetical protein VM802_20345 [Chitinophaga sp.]|uniref:hypothetical protein n=1 Tax=Chitinophaga sp. TaxID=1869181 RepID=UPI002BD8D47F|nr:hypothetical protein [Chitinophaga sp.]HVI47239.1 hypothetical protein [Chitinophaga sp.]
MKSVIFLLIMLGTALPLCAQEPDSPLSFNTSYNKEEDLVTKIFGKNRLLLISEFLKISPVEARSFEEALLEYEEEKSPWFTERMTLLKMYNEEFSSLDERKMNSLTKQFMNNDLDFSRLQMRYFRRMNKLLGATRAAQFFQLDNYLEQTTRAYVQHQLPFIKELESDRQSKQNKPVATR